MPIRIDHLGLFQLLFKQVMEFKNGTGVFTAHFSVRGDFSISGAAFPVQSSPNKEIQIVSSAKGI